MYLKSLDIRGFKSFADSTHIEFTTGLNLIVGPNGCGKSNLVDAIRWALGEQNVRNLRGQKLEDVIFAGTDQKKPLSLASVSLTIDNSDQALPTPYTEIMVSRRVYRSEQSEFYLNQQPVRLKDINQLFYGTGVGRKGYAIIGQGEIENLLSARPHDIRLMLEEASGLIRYRYQKDEAMERLKSTDRDLQRLQDITGELENRLQELKVKAEKASKYLALSNERQTVHTTLLKSEWSVLKQEIEVLQAALTDHQKGIETISTETVHLEAENNRLTIDHQHWQQQLDETRNRRFEAMSTFNQQTAYSNSLREKLQEANLRRAEIMEEKQNLEAQMATFSQELDAIRDRIAAAQKVWEQEKNKLSALKQEWQQQVNDQQNSLQQLEQLRKQAMDKAQEAAALRNRIQQANDEINQLANRAQQYELEIEQRSEYMQALQEQSANLDKDIVNIEQQLDQVRKEGQVLEQQQKQWNEQREAAQNQVAECQRRLTQIKHELQTLQNIDDNYTGYSETVRVLLKKNQKDPGFMPGLLGVAGELIQVPPGLETAIETALGRGMENLIVTSETDARQGIEFLKREKAGRATFLPLKNLKVEPLKPSLLQQLKKEQGVLGIASDLISYPDEIRPALQFLLGRIVIVDNLDTGLRLQKSGNYNLRLVTKEGEVLLPQGAITGGKRQHDSSILTRKNRKQALVKEQQQMLIDEQKWAAEEEKLAKAEKSTREKLQMKQQQYQSLVFQLQQLNDEKGKLAQQLTHQSQRLQEIQLKGEQLLAEEQQHQQQLSQWQTELGKQAAEEVLIQEELIRCKQAADDLLRMIEVGKEKINTQNTVVTAREQELNSLQANLEQTEHIYQSWINNVHQQEARLNNLAQQRKQWENELSRLALELARSDQEQLKLTEQEQKIQEKLQEIGGQTAVVSNRLNETRFELEKLQDKRRQVEVRLARQETEFAIFDQQLSEEEKAEPAVILSDKKLRELRQQEARLASQMEEIGAVDPGSVDEFKNTSERYALLSTQYQDLINARTSLIKLVKDSEQIMQGRFGEFLQEANDSFGRTFSEIFGGGEAALSLLEDDEDGGVELIVKMPGKKRQSLNMLSGGERALTCIALILALLRLKPVPFCLLDEIDAALDEVNLQRFAQFIRRMSRDIQFIIISHRQGTIEIADTLYGITMPQRGVSTVLSVPMEEREQMVG